MATSASHDAIDTVTATPADTPTTDEHPEGASEDARSADDGQRSTTAEANGPDDEVPAAGRAAAEADGEGDGQAGGPQPLVGEGDRFRARWESVQIGFVDDPREAVGQADELVTQVLDDLLSSFQQQRSGLEALWSGGGDASTDDLRQAFQRYRMFFDRLLNV